MNKLLNIIGVNMLMGLVALGFLVHFNVIDISDATRHEFSQMKNDSIGFAAYALGELEKEYRDWQKDLAGAISPYQTATVSFLNKTSDSLLKRFVFAPFPARKNSPTLPTTIAQVSQAITQPTTSINADLFIGDLRRELQGYINTRFSNISQPTAITYEFNPVQVIKTVEPAIHYTVSRQSDSDTSHISSNLSSNLSALTDSGTFSDITINGGTATLDTLCLDTCEDSWPAGYTDTDANSFIHASTTIAKTYSNNTFSGTNTFSGGLTTLANLLLTSSSTLQAFTATQSTTTSATTTNFYFSNSLTGNGPLTLNAQNELRLADNNSSNYVGFKSPTNVGSNVIWTLPSADASGCLKSNGAGLISIDTCGDNAVSAGGLTNDFRGLYLRTGVDGSLTNGNATNTVIMIHADEIVTKDGSRHTPANNLTADIRVSGIGGLRAGQTETASTWYKIMYAYGGSGEGIYLEQAKDYYLDQQQTTGNTTESVALSTGTRTAVAQTFAPDTTGYVEFVDVKISKLNSPTGRVWAEIRATSGGTPTGSALATSDKLDPSLLVASGSGSQWVRFVFRSPISLTALTTYALVLTADQALSDTNNIHWWANTSGGYGSGDEFKLAGGTWSSFGQGDDFAFKVYVTRNDNTPAPPSGYNTSYAQIGWVYNDGNGHFDQFTATDRRVMKGDNEVDVAATIKTLTDASAMIPPVAVATEWAISNTTAGSFNYTAGIPDGFNDADGDNGRMQTKIYSPGGYTTSGTVNTEFQAAYLKVSAGAGRWQLYQYEWSASNIGTPSSAAPGEVWLLNDTNDAYYTSGKVGVGSSTPYAKFSITGTGTGTGLGLLFADSSNAPKFSILDNGNVGIGTTTPNNKLDIYSTTKSAIGFSGASGDTYKWTLGMDVSNGGRFSIASSTALGTTDRFVIDGNGNVGIGTASPSSTLHVAGVTRTGGIISTDSSISRETIDGSDNASLFLIGGGGLSHDRSAYVGVYGNEASGNVLIGIGNVASSRLFVKRGDQNEVLSISGTNGSAVFTATGEGANGHAFTFVDSKATSPVGIIVQYTGAAPNNTASPFFKCYDTGADPRCEIRSNGGLANYSANNVNLSDERMKNLFGDAPSELERFSQLKFVLGEYKDNPLEIKDVMLTAQQVQTVYPELITTFSEQTGTLGIREGALALRVFKVVQEIVTLADSFKSKLIAWLADAANGITKLFAGEVHTDNLCVKKSDGSEVCVNGDQIEALISGANLSSGGGGLSSDSSGGDGGEEVSGDDTATSTEEIVDEETASSTEEVIAEEEPPPDNTSTTTPNQSSGEDGTGQASEVSP